MAEYTADAELSRTLRGSLARNRITSTSMTSITMKHTKILRRRSVYGPSNSMANFNGPVTRAASRRLEQALTSRRTSLSPEGNIVEVSELYHTTLRTWSLLLKQKSWPFGWRPFPGVMNVITSPEPLENEPSTSIPVTPASEMENDENYFVSQNVDLEVDILSQRPESVLYGFAPRRESLHRFMLGQERDKLRLWKFSFSDECLNCLMDSKVEVGSSVMESLVSIAEVLLCVAVPGDGVDIDSQIDGGIHTSLQKTGNELRDLVENAKKSIARAAPDDEMEDLCDSTMSDTVDSGSTGGTQASGSQSRGPDTSDLEVPASNINKPSLLEHLKSGVKRLQRLSFSIRLALQEMKDQETSDESCI